MKLFVLGCVKFLVQGRLPLIVVRGLCAPQLVLKDGGAQKPRTTMDRPKLMPKTLHTLCFRLG